MTETTTAKPAGQASKLVAWSLPLFGLAILCFILGAPFALDSEIAFVVGFAFLAIFFLMMSVVVVITGRLFLRKRWRWTAAGVFAWLGGQWLYVLLVFGTEDEDAPGYWSTFDIAALKTGDVISFANEVLTILVAIQMFRFGRMAGTSRWKTVALLYGLPSLPAFVIAERMPDFALSEFGTMPGLIYSALFFLFLALVLAGWFLHGRALGEEALQDEKRDQFG